MKILNAIYAQEIGGVNTMFCGYSKALKKAGHEVFALSCDKRKCDFDDISNDKIFKLKNWSQFSDFLHLFLILLLYRPQIVICHSNRIMKWLKIIQKIFPKITKSVAVNHGISVKSSLHCDFVISVNEEIHKRAVGLGFNHEKSFVLQNSIEVKQPYFQKKFNNQKPRIGIYGRLEYRKGFDILIKAVANLAQQNCDFVLKIGGFEVFDGYNFQIIKNLAKELNILDKCEFVGIVSDPKEFFRDVDIFVVPSREEPFGLVILESFANSTLTISSDSEGGKILINDGIDGFLFKNEDSEDLARKIIYSLQNPQNYNQITHNSYQKLQNQFSFNSFCQKIDKILDKIAIFSA